MDDPHQQKSTIHNVVTGEVVSLSPEAIKMTMAGDANWRRGEAPPRGWERETPRYKATRDLHPPALARMGLETPWTSCNNEHTWQYAPGTVRDGEIVATTSWPHESFRPLNESAKRIHNFFSTATKSRMQLRPWADGRINIDDGMSFGEAEVKRSA
jgi:hypothetical protein